MGTSLLIKFLFYFFKFLISSLIDEVGFPFLALTGIYFVGFFGFGFTYGTAFISLSK